VILHDRLQDGFENQNHSMFGDVEGGLDSGGGGGRGPGNALGDVRGGGGGGGDGRGAANETHAGRTDDDGVSSGQETVIAHGTSSSDTEGQSGDGGGKRARAHLTGQPQGPKIIAGELSDRHGAANGCSGLRQRPAARAGGTNVSTPASRQSPHRPLVMVAAASRRRGLLQRKRKGNDPGALEGSPTEIHRTASSRDVALAVGDCSSAPVSVSATQPHGAASGALARTSEQLLLGRRPSPSGRERAPSVAATLEGALSSVRGRRTDERAMRWLMHRARDERPASAGAPGAEVAPGDGGGAGAGDAVEAMVAMSTLVEDNDDEDQAGAPPGRGEA